MKAPPFWSRADSWQARLLAPLGTLYGLGTAWRFVRTHPLRLPIPVVCVGNVVAGGAGKTPVVRALAAHFRAAGLDAHCLSRGYGGRKFGPLRVDPERHTWRQVGDEPLLLAEVAPTWIARNRVKGAQAALAAGAQALILDDGFQDPSLAKDLSLLVVDGGFGLGNGRMIPAGPLREPLSFALARTDAVVMVGEDRTLLAPHLAPLLASRPLYGARLAPDALGREWAGHRVLAFAGIGRPEKFFDTLREMGCTLAETRAFPDHHPYRLKEVAELVARAQALGALPLTTAKDAVRLPRELKGQIGVLGVALEWADPEVPDQILDAVFAHAR